MNDECQFVNGELYLYHERANAIQLTIMQYCKVSNSVNPASKLLVYNYQNEQILHKSA